LKAYRDAKSYDTRIGPQSWLIANPATILSGTDVPEDGSGEQSHAEPMGANREGDFSRWYSKTIGHGGTDRPLGNLTQRESGLHLPTLTTPK